MKSKMTKDLSYTQIFPIKKVIPHEEALREKIKSGIIHIMMDENKVSEKAFSRVHEIIDLVGSKFTNDMLDFSLKEYQLGKRPEYIAEILYDNHFKNEILNESKISKFKDF